MARRWHVFVMLLDGILLLSGEFVEMLQPMLRAYTILQTVLLATILLQPASKLLPKHCNGSQLQYLPQCLYFWFADLHQTQNADLTKFCSFAFLAYKTPRAHGSTTCSYSLLEIYCYSATRFQTQNCIYYCQKYSVLAIHHANSANDSEKVNMDNIDGFVRISQVESSTGITQGQKLSQITETYSQTI